MHLMALLSTRGQLPIKRRRVSSLAVDDSKRIGNSAKLTAMIGPQAVVARTCLAAFILLLAIGCRGGDDSEAPRDDSVGTTATLETPDAVLSQMIKAYQEASAYRDRGRLRLAYELDGQPQENLTPLTVRYAQPNKFRLNAYQVELASDGEKTRGLVEDAPSGNLDGQFAVRPSPERVTLKWLYEDQVIAGLIHRGLGRQPVTLELLFAKEPLEAFLKEDVERELLGDATLNDRKCRRVKVSATEGDFVLWIDRENSLLHRMEYPTTEVEKQLSGTGAVSKVVLAAEFFEAKFSAPPDSQFSIKQPSDAKVVQHLVTPPQPLPSELFGQIPERFQFLNLDTGKTLNSQDLRGKLTALLWFSNHPAGQQAAKQFDRIRRANQNEDVQFILVCAEPADTSDDAVKTLVESWDCLGRVARDTDAVGRDVFGIDLLPTLVVLDDAGIVHVFDEGYNEQLETDLPAVMGMLRKGENVSAAVVEQAENERLRYQRALSQEGVDSSQARAAAPTRRRFPKRTKPFEFEMKEVWSCDKLKAPGNLLAAGSEWPNLYVNEGWRSVAELNTGDGSVIAVRELELPEAASISRISTPRGNLAGNVFVATDLLARQAHAIDADWNVLFSYPEPEQDHAGIRDALIEDFNDNGKWQLVVGFWELLGVHGVDQEGKRAWSNRECGSVQSLATTPTSPAGWRRLMVTGDTGRIHSYNHYGNPDPPVRLQDPVEQLFLAANAGAESVFCAVSEDRFGRRKIRGLDRKMDELWSYDNVPGGAFTNRVHFVASGRLRIAGQPTPVWAIVGPDGSLHLISHDGRFNDFFYMGQAIHGVAFVERGDFNLLCLSTANHVTAYSMEAGSSE